MEKEIREIADLVWQLKREDRDLRVYGASSHQYQIGPTLSESELRAFEQQHGIELPPDFRLWLQLVGDGSGRKGQWRIAGVGPDNGLHHLREMAEDSRLNMPFVPTLDVTAANSNQFTIDYDDEDYLSGVLVIGHAGGSHNSYLVVNGEKYGTIWNSWEWTQTWPTDLTFSAWVRDWAEEKIPRVIRERITDKIELGMTKSQVEEICGAELKEKYSSLNFRNFGMEHFVTAVELDEYEKVVRIIKHSI